MIKLINPNELMSNLIMEFGDDNSEITKFWLDKIESEINDCQDYSQYIIVKDNSMTKEKLNEIQLFWQPELVFAEKDGYKLVLEIDAFNNHMYWNVKWVEEYDGLEHYIEFADFPGARDYFLEKTSH